MRVKELVEDGFLFLLQISPGGLLITSEFHCVKSVRIRSFSGPYLVQMLGKYGPEKFPIWGLFTEFL